MKPNSHIYRSRLKAFTELVKGLYPTLRRVPAPLPKPGSPANTISPKLNAKEATVRKEVWTAQDAGRLDREAVSYWMTEMEGAK